MLRYGVSYRVLRRSLERLAAERTLTPERRSYRVRPSQPLPTQTLYLFVGGTITRRPPPGNTQTIERECARANLRLVVVRHVWRGTVMEFDHPANFSKEQLKHIIGFMVWTMGYHDKACAEVLGIVHQYGKPVGIFDERQGYHETPIPFANRLTRCAVVAQREDEGAALGRYLLDRGHRKILYASLPGFDFNDIRYSGLCSMFSRAGIADGVTATSLPSKLPPIPSANAEHTNPIDEVIEKQGATAIVGYNDTAALAVLRYLRERGIAVPGRVSVVGFDDSPEASLEGLTSYNFNSQEAISLLVGHILSDPARRLRRAPPVDLVQGYVTERASSGLAPS
jgi:hypothetical protein